MMRLRHCAETTDTPTPQHTPGPWRWEVRPKDKVVELVGGGKRRYDLTVLQPTRWGMNGATVLLQETDRSQPHVTYKLMIERPEWCQPLPGREHHAQWIQTVNHPDLLLIQAAPDMLQAPLGQRIKLLPGERARHVYLSPDDVERLAAACSDPACAMAIRLSARTGLRETEVLRAATIRDGCIENGTTEKEQ